MLSFVETCENILVNINVWCNLPDLYNFAEKVAKINEVIFFYSSFPVSRGNFTENFPFHCSENLVDFGHFVA